MPLKYNGFDQVPAALKFVLPAAFVLAAGCSSPPPKPAEPAASPPPAAEAPPPVADQGQATPAADVSLKPSAPLTYVVKKGDTLWDISSYYLQDPWQWPQLWYDNPQIQNPHLIYPGDRLKLIWVKGRQRLSLDGSYLSPEHVTRLSPSVRVESLDQALPAIPVDQIRQFLRSPRLVTQDELKTAPYIVGFPDEHVAAGANDNIFVKKMIPNRSVWEVVEPGDAYVDPDTKEILGYEAIPVGNAEVRVLADPVSTLRLTTSDREAQIGDRLLPLETKPFNAAFVPHAPAKPVEGRIMSVFGGVTEAAQYQIVAINRGSRDGVDDGTVLAIHRAGAVVGDPYQPSATVQLPDVYAGVLMVFKTTPRMSYALVMQETRPAYVLDRVSKPKPGEH